MAHSKQILFMFFLIFFSSFFFCFFTETRKYFYELGLANLLSGMYHDVIEVFNILFSEQRLQENLEIIYD